MITEIFIEGERLDLFDDESISITQSVQDVKDISKIFADYSQSFNVPASKNNNRILKNWYNQDIDNGFDARIRKDAVVNVNTIPFKTGKIQLNGAKLKHGNPTQYSLTFYGDVIKVRDLIGDDKLFDLDWLSNFDHDYTDTNVFDALENGLDFTVDGTLYEKAIVYPLISYTRQYLYNSNPSDTTSSDTLVNIAYDAGRTDGVSFDDLKPAIKLSLIIEAITQKYGINFVGGFFDSEVFNQIYMNLNKTTDRLSNGFLRYEDVLSGVDNPDPAFANLDRYVYGTIITPRPGFENTPYKIVLSINGSVIAETPNFVQGSYNLVGVDENVQDGAVSWTADVISISDFEFDAVTEGKYELVLPSGIADISLFTNTYTNQVINLDTIILDQLSDIRVYDFLIGVFKTFNLTVSPLNGDILVEDLQTWYTKGDIIDVTKYVDTEEKEIDKGVIFNEIDFEFKESPQILADNFRQSNNRIYGNEDLTLYTDATQTKKLDGKTLKVESVFENPIFERLFDLNDNTQTSIQYCPYFDKEIKPISENPFIFFAASVDLSQNPIGLKGSPGNPITELNTFCYMPSHSQVINNFSFNLNFAAEINEYTGNVMTDTIYNRYWADYVSDVFSIKRRIFKYKAILPLSILNNLKLNDRLIIGNTRYLINKITSELTKRKDTLELLNDIYDAPLQSDQLNRSVWNPQGRYYNGESNTDSAQYIGLSGQNLKKTDLGDDVTWLTINSFENSTTNSTVNFTIDANNTGVDRVVAIECLDGINNPLFFIRQAAGSITVDNTVITVDNNIITSDADG